ncbi:MAG: cytochrome ubiquinol oxidase subunit I, partial [Sulfuricaulis sp.]|uniref:cytochrome ubiquinol oxidase subunit I n=1 Tax=Sulfuricaulis sp. TaxID=2003553 RepID=UPI003C5E7FCA
VEMGWVTREVGRQPWVVEGLVRTADAASALPAGTVLTTLVAYVVIYLAVLAGFLVFAGRIIQRGPDLDEPVPARRGEPAAHRTRARARRHTPGVGGLTP